MVCRLRLPLAALVCASCLLLAAAASPSLSYGYTYKQTAAGTVATSYLQEVSASSASGAACTSAADCLAQCPTEDFIASGNATTATVEQQLTNCTNALRTYPAAFADAINAVCSLNAFLNNITTPPNDMAANNTFSHTSSTGLSPADRIRAEIDTNAVGEVIAAGYSSVLGVMVAFFCSGSHLDILTSCAYDTIGWGVEFGYTLDGQPIRTPYNSYFTGDLLCSNPGGCSCPSSAVSPSAGPTAGATAAAPTAGATVTVPVVAAPLPPSSSTPTPLIASPSLPPPIQQSLPPAGQGPPGISAIQITFVVLFLDIGANSLNEPQILSVELDVRNAITAYVTPTMVGISINGSTPSAAPGPSGPPQEVSAAPINFNPPPQASQIAPSPLGRRLLQADNTVQPTVTFTATTAAPSSSTLVNGLSSAISAYTAPIMVSVSAMRELSGSLNMTVQFPPNNQVSTNTSYTTELADKFANAVANQTNTVFASFIAEDGAITVSNVSVIVTPVVATAATDLGPTPSIIVATPGSSSSTTAASTPQVAAAPLPTLATPPSGTPPSGPPPSAPPPLILPSPPTPVPSPAATPVASPSQPPFTPLVLAVAVTFLANETELIQNFTNALQNTPQAVFFSVVAADGQIEVQNVQSSAGSAAAIEEFTPPPSVATAAQPTLPGSAPAPTPPAVAPISVPASVPVSVPSFAAPVASPSAPTCSLFALNMQFTTGMASTDQSSATLLAVFPTAAGPLASQFSVALSGGLAGSVGGVMPSSLNFFLVQVSTPEGYYGPVTVSYSTGQLGSLTYHVVPSLVVKVTASSLLF